MADLRVPRMPARRVAQVLAVVVLAPLMALVPYTAPVEAAHGGDGDLDTTFAGDGVFEGAFAGSVAQGPRAVVVQSDGKIVTAFRSSAGATTVGLTRLNSDGSPDASFGTNPDQPGLTDESLPGTSVEHVGDVALQADGKILVTGQDSPTGGQAGMFVARYLPDGALDSTFGSNGVTHVEIAASGGDIGHAITVDDSGRIVVGGAHPDPAGSAGETCLVLHFLDTSGARTGGPGACGRSPVDRVNDVMVLPDGRTLAAGVLTNTGGDPEFTLWQTNPDGSNDTSFGGNGFVNLNISPGGFADSEFASAVTLDGSGRIVAAGTAWICNGGSGQSLAVVRVLADGTLDTSFDGDGILYSCPTEPEGPLSIAAMGAVARDVTIQDDGKILVSGTADGPEGVEPQYMFVARLGADGSYDPTYADRGVALVSGGTSTAEGWGLALQDDGKAVVAGENDAGEVLVARLLGPVAPTSNGADAPGLIAFGSNRSGPEEIWTVFPDGTHQQQVTGFGEVATSPSFAPGGTRVVYAAGNGSSTNDLFMADLDGANVVQLTSNAAGSDPGLGHDAVPNVSPDGGRLAFASSEVDGTYRLYVAEIATMAANPADTSHWIAIHSGSPFYRPSWSPDGTRVLFHAEGGNFFVAPADGSAAPTQVTNDAFNDNDADWSPVPGDTRAVFARPVEGARRQIFILDVATSGVVQVTDNAHSDYFPSFSPDGQWVVFTRDIGGNHDIWIRELATGEEHQLTTDGAQDRRPAWVDNLSLVAADVLSPSPASIPVGSIPLNRQSPELQTAPDLKDLLNATPDLKDLLNAIPDLKDLLNAIPDLKDLLNATPDLKDLLNATPDLKDLLNATPDLKDLLNATPVEQALAGIPLSALDLDPALRAQIIATGGWTELESHQITLLDLVQNEAVMDLLVSLDPGIDQFDFSTTALSEIGLGMWMLGVDTEIRHIDTSDASYYATGALEGFDGFCASLEGLYGGVCGDTRLGVSGQSYSMIELALAGVPLDDPVHLLPFFLVRWGDVDVATGSDGRLRARVLDLPLSAIEFSTFPNTFVADLPSSAAVLDGCAESPETLWEAQQQGCISASATLEDLGLGASSAIADVSLLELTLGIVGMELAELFPYEDFPADLPEYGITSYSGEGSSPATLTARWAAPSIEGGYSDTVRFAVTVPNEFVVHDHLVGVARRNGAESCTGTTPTKTQGADTTTLVVECAFPSGAVGEGDVITAAFDVLPGLDLAVHRLSLELDVLPVSQRHERIVEVADVFETGNDVASAVTLDRNDIAGGRMYLSYSEPGDRDYFLVHLEENEVLDVVLGNTASAYDNDLFVSYPLGLQPYEPMHAVNDVLAEPIAISDAGLTAYDGREQVLAETRQDIGIPKDRALAGLSDHRGSTTEHVEVLALEAGDYLIGVDPYVQLEDSVDVGPTLYTLRLGIRGTTTSPVPCAPRHEGGAAPTWSNAGSPLVAEDVPADVDTVFLVEWDRMTHLDGAETVADLQAELEAFRQRSDINGVVVPVGAYPHVRAAIEAADAAPCSESANNGGVRAINDLVDALEGRQQIAGVSALLAGQDITNIVLVGSPEVVPTGLVPDLGQFGNEAWFQQDRLSATGGAGNGVGGHTSAYQSDDPYGVTSPTPYVGRWLYAPVRAVGRIGETAADARTQLGAYQAANGVLGTPQHNAATAAAFGTEFMQDLAHALDASNDARAGDQPVFPEGWSIDDVAGTDPDILQLNAHSSWQSIRAPAPDSTGTLRLTTENAESKAGHLLDGVLWMTIGCHTGFMFADELAASATEGVDWSQLLSESALIAPSGYGLGHVHTVAWNERTEAILTDNIANGTVGQALMTTKQTYLLETGVISPYDEKAATQLRLAGLPMWRVPGATPFAPPESTVSPAEDPDTGTMTADITLNHSYDAPVTTPDGTIQPIEGRTWEAPGHAILGRDVADVTADGLVATGAVLLGQTLDSSSLVEDYDPVFAALSVASGGSGAEPQPGKVFSPGAPVSFTSFGGRQNVVVVPATFESTGQDGAGHTVGRYLRSSSSTVRVFYGDPADGIAPEFQEAVAVHTTNVNGSGGRATFEVTVTDQVRDGSAVAAGDVAEVWISWLDSNGWHTAPATRVAGTDQWRLEDQPYSGDGVRWGAQAVDTNGWAGLVWGKGALLSSIPVELDPGEGQFAPLVFVRTPQPLDTYVWKETVNVDYECLPGSAELVSCEGSVPDGTPLDTSKVGERTFTVTARDVDGQETTVNVPYQVVYDFGGFFSPVQNDVLNRVAAGRNVPVKWDLRDANGAYQRSLFVVEVIDTHEISCQGMAVVDVSLIDLPLSTLHYDLADEQYVYGFKTQKAWKDTCRALNVRLNDGTIHTAYFMFA